MTDVKPTILVVDDEAEMIRKPLVRQLRRAFRGYSFLEAENGEVALDLVEKHQPKLVVLDLMMPVMDGITALERMKERQQLKKTRVLVYTAAADKELRIRALKIGAIDYLDKTSPIEEVLARVHNFLSMESTDEALIQAHAANEVKSRFLSSMISKLKEPIADTLSLTQVLNLETDAALSDDQKGYISEITHNSETLLSLLEWLSKLHRIENNKLFSGFKNISIENVVEDVLELVTPTAQSSNITIKAPSSDTVFPKIRTDETLLSQALRVVLHETLKHCHSGAEVSIDLLKTDDESLRIIIKDNRQTEQTPETNLDMDPLELLSDEHFLEDNTGPDIGLNIMQQVMEALGGKIDFSNEANIGHSCAIELPLKHQRSDVFERLYGERQALM
ncbi:hypothetical protein MTBPR1_190008 [Candidatus Terasakiella magnetica]|uniref:Histidine kinase n=1 Tax=Candidatus Terasakiella magnetica TaxID=1867952 RepID=A0A1C3RFS3_9PROT|nr:response regulator [Candidatus Terasakiella magnetica]SCA56130.1 hypothetical protein MTBPR1_190008 [Candidatus Terasakiella magnetica]